MPLYQYRCPACSRQFELLLPNARAPLPMCPDCGKQTEKMLTAPGGIRTKGPGPGDAHVHGHGHQPCCGAAAPCDSPNRCCGH